VPDPHGPGCLLFAPAGRRSGRGASGSACYALILAARITLPHFSVSPARNLPYSATVIDTGTLPRSARQAFTAGSARAALISLLRRSTISEGVFLGAARPVIKLAS